MSQLSETFLINNRINLYLLDAIAPESLNDKSVAKGRSVGEQFAHLHQVRLMWLKEAMPEMMDKLSPLDKRNITHETLTQALTESAEAMAQLLEKGEETGKIKGFKPNATAFMGYLLAHEAHHRGQIALSLKQAGHPLDKKIAYGMWEWGVR